MASIQSSKYLPQDLATAILVRLPAKSLVRFRCVHTSWNALFRTRTFVMDHYSYSSQREHLMIFDTHNVYDFCEHYEVPVVIHNDDPAQPPHPHHHVPLSPLARQDKKLRQMLPYSSCNGIFFMCGIYTDDTYQLMLWNPGTREVKVVPPPPHCHPPPADGVFSYLNWDDMLYKPTFGFGVDRETNDYKIVSLELNRYGVTSKVYVYSLSTDSWATTIHEDVPRVAAFSDSFQLIGSTHAYGVCHWFYGSNHSDYYEESGILCFDLSNNRFKLIKLPVNNYNVYHQWEECCGYERSFLVNDSIGYVACYPDLNNQENKNYRLGVWVFDKVDGDERWLD